MFLAALVLAATPYTIVLGIAQDGGLATSPLKSRVRFIHLNQSNPLLRAKRAGITVARDGEREGL